MSDDKPPENNGGTGEFDPSTRVWISEFTSRFDNEPKGRFWTWSEFVERLKKRTVRADKEAGPLFSPAQYPAGVKRSATSVFEVTAAVLDVDDGWSPAEAEDLLRTDGYEFVIYTTHSHSPEKPKIRIVAPIANPCPGKLWADRWARIAELFHGHVDPGTFDPSRMFWYPSCPPGAEGWSEFRAGHGHPIDLDALPPAKKTPKERDPQNWDDAATGPTLTAGQRHPFLISYAKRLRWAGSSFDTIVAELSRVNAARCDPPKGDGEIRDLADWVMTKKPRAKDRIPSTGPQGPAAPAPPEAVEARRPELLSRTAPEFPASTPFEGPLPLIWVPDPEGGPPRFNHAGAVFGLLHVQRFAAFPDTKEVRRYEAGVYVEGAEAFVHSWVERQFHHQRLSAKRQHREEVFAAVRASSFIDRDLFDPPGFVCTSNGILNLDTLTPEDHSPSRYFTRKLPYDYDAKATCPRSLEAIRAMFPDQKTLEFAQEWIGYHFERGNPFKKALMLLGKLGDNGKTVYLKLIEIIFGADVVSHISIQRLCGEGRFEVYQLAGKVANTYGDVPDHPLPFVGDFKALTGNDAIEAEVKGVQTRPRFVNSAKFTFSANSPPRVDSTSQPFWDRWFILVFTHKFVQGVDMIPLDDLLKVFEAERPGLLNWALVGRRRLLDRGRFDPPPESLLAQEIWIQESDSLRWYVGKCWEPSKAVNPEEGATEGDGWILKHTLAREYLDFCRGNEVDAKGAREIGSRLPELIHGLRSSQLRKGELIVDKKSKSTGEHRREWCWVGLQRKKPPEGSDASGESPSAAATPPLDPQRTIDGDTVAPPAIPPMPPSSRPEAPSVSRDTGSGSVTLPPSERLDVTASSGGSPPQYSSLTPTPCSSPDFPADKEKRQDSKTHVTATDSNPESCLKTEPLRTPKTSRSEPIPEEDLTGGRLTRADRAREARTTESVRVLRDFLRDRSAGLHADEVRAALGAKEFSEAEVDRAIARASADGEVEERGDYLLARRKA